MRWCCSGTPVGRRGCLGTEVHCRGLRSLQGYPIVGRVLLALYAECQQSDQVGMHKSTAEKVNGYERPAQGMNRNEGPGFVIASSQCAVVLPTSWLPELRIPRIADKDWALPAQGSAALSSWSQVKAMTSAMFQVHHPLFRLDECFTEVQHAVRFFRT
jgi:hypothetical protein